MSLCPQIKVEHFERILVCLCPQISSKSLKFKHFERFLVDLWPQIPADLSIFERVTVNVNPFSEPS